MDAAPVLHAFQRERILEVWQEAVPLMQKHWEEIAKYKDIPLDPDPVIYAAAESSGFLRCFTVRDPGGKLVGYAVYMVRHAPHYRGSLQAIEDVIFLDPSVRGKMVGIRFIDWCDRQLRGEGVQVTYHHVKKDHAALGRILEHLGYELSDLVYARRLDHGRSSDR